MVRLFRASCGSGLRGESGYPVRSCGLGIFVQESGRARHDLGRRNVGAFCTFFGTSGQQCGNRFGGAFCRIQPDTCGFGNGCDACFCLDGIGQSFERTETVEQGAGFY